MILLLVACVETTPEDCPWPEAAVVADGVLENVDTCGYWSIVGDDHLYVNVALTEPDMDCSAAMDAEVALNSAPIYSNLTTDGPKWTFDVVGLAPTDTFASFDVTCAEGTRWVARIDVE